MRSPLFPSSRSACALGAVVCFASLASAQVVLDPMEAATFAFPEGKGSVEVVSEGKVGKALRLHFPTEAKSVFASGHVRGASDWDTAAGISFWVKGDGSQRCGGLEFVWNENYSLRYDCAFSLDSTEWKKVTIPWRDLIPVTPVPGANPLDASNGNAPSKLGNLWFGKWWYWRDTGAQTFDIDQISLEPRIDLDTHDYRPAGLPLERVLAKLKRGEPITIVTMGDSLTDYNHWSNHETNWPTFLKNALHESHGSDVTIINPAIGGTQLRQNVVLIPYWTMQNAHPDLVTIFFGGNDWESGMRGEMFLEAQKDAVDRVRRATGGAADVLILSTSPSVAKWNDYAELAEACRKGAKDRNAGLADVYALFHKEADAAPERMFAWDKVHLGPEGQKAVASCVRSAIESGGR